MAKGIKTGGRTSVDGEPKSDVIRVKPSKRQPVERFRDLLDNPDIRDIALHALNDLEAIANQVTHDE